MMRLSILLLVLLALTCRTEFITINGQTIICTICGTMTWCNPA